MDPNGGSWWIQLVLLDKHLWKNSTLALPFLVNFCIVIINDQTSSQSVNGITFLTEQYLGMAHLNLLYWYFSRISILGYKRIFLHLH